MRHVLKLPLGVLNALSDIASKILEDIGKVIFLGSSLTGCSLVLGIGCDSAVGIKTLDDTLGFLENTAAFLNQGTNFADECFLVALIFRRALGFVNFLE